jgi:hypothetical protein
VFSSVAISTVSTAVISGVGALIVVLVLFTLLVQKEVATASDNSHLRKLSQILNIAIVPLIIAFILIVAYRVIDVLQ